MRIIVSDSSCLIDIRKASLIDAFLKLPYEILIPDTLFEDELLKFTDVQKRALISGGIKIIDLPGDSVLRAQQAVREGNRSHPPALLPPAPLLRSALFKTLRPDLFEVREVAKSAFACQAECGNVAAFGLPAQLLEYPKTKHPSFPPNSGGHDMCSARFRRARTGLPADQNRCRGFKLICSVP